MKWWGAFRFVIWISIGMLFGNIAIPSSASAAPAQLLCFKLETTKALTFKVASAKCPAGWKQEKRDLKTLNQIVELVNQVAQAEFTLGWRFGNYQTSVQQQGTPCLPGQQGCNP